MKIDIRSYLVGGPQITPEARKEWLESLEQLRAIKERIRREHGTVDTAELVRNARDDYGA